MEAKNEIFNLMDDNLENSYKNEKSPSWQRFIISSSIQKITYESKGKTKASYDGRHVGLDSFSFIKWCYDYHWGRE